MNESEQLVSRLKRILEILSGAREDRWVRYFQAALDLVERGKTSEAKKRIRGAFGGMGSFNDNSLNFISDERNEEAVGLANQLLKESESEGFFARLFRK